MTDQLVATDLFEVEGDSAVLIAGRCDDCGAISFPRTLGCARCTGENISAHRLATSGELWAFTIQSFRPKPPYDGPEEFTPFGVGYVNLGGEVLVEGWLTENDPERLRVGLPMTAVPHVYNTTAEGANVLTFAFAPTGA